jgi:hypothetical protein
VTTSNDDSIAMLERRIEALERDREFLIESALDALLSRALNSCSNCWDATTRRSIGCRQCGETGTRTGQIERAREGAVEDVMENIDVDSLVDGARRRERAACAEECVRNVPKHILLLNPPQPARTQTLDDGTARVVDDRVDQASAILLRDRILFRGDR